MKFAGKTAFITGGASGIGLGLAQAFLEEGGRIVVTDVVDARLSAACEALGTDRALYLRLDVTDRAAWAETADKAESRFGVVDVLFNNAGVNAEISLADAAYEDWDWMLGVNLGGCINGMMTFVPRFRRQGTPTHIVNTSSIVSIIPFGPTPIYTTSKFAVRGLSAVARLDLAPYGIGVSCLCPALVRSNGGTAERTRQSRFQVAGRAAPKESRDFGALNELGMEPIQVGRLALRGIEDNAELIFTHPEHVDEVRELQARIIAAFPIDDAVPEGRGLTELALREMRRAARAASDSVPSVVGKSVKGPAAPL